MVDQVNNYISANILHSKVWDVANETVRLKAVNNAERVLKMMLPKYYPDTVPVDHLAEQVLWMLKIDDSIQRSELGVTYIQIDGIAMNISEKDRSIAPFIYRALDLPEGYFNRRRVARYSDPRHIHRYRC